MNLPTKLLNLLALRGFTPSHLRTAANISRPTWYRILRGHIPSDRTLSRIAEVLEVSPRYLRGGYRLPAWLSEEDVLFLADRRNVELLQMVREAAGRGLSVDDLRRLFDILNKEGF